jgi:hypothetical protein
MTDPDDQFDELMRRSLAEEADRIEPADHLHDIQARVAGQRKPAVRRPWAIAAGAAVVGTAAAIGAFAVLNDSNTKTADEPTVAGPAGTTTSATAQPGTKLPTLPSSAKPAPSQAATELPSTPKARATTEPAVRGQSVPIYWVGKTVGNTTGAGIRLYRTFSRVSGRPAYEAVRLLTDARSDDPDYYTLWRGAAVSSVTRSDGVVTVDFKVLPKQQLDPDVAEVAVQQLVYTVQGALGDSSQKVQVTEQGRAGSTLFGQVDTSTPFSRAQAADVQALVWITSPVNGEAIKNLLTVEGVASAFEAQVNWQAINLKTRQTLKNFTMTKEGQKLSPFLFTTKLGPGQWQIEAYLVSPEDGHITDTDSKVVYVKGN